MQSSEFSEHLERIRAGDRSELEELLAAWRPILRLQARGLLGERYAARVDSSDVVQETMTQAFRDFFQFRGGSEKELAGWLRKILQSQAAKLMRYHAAEKRSIDREMPGGDAAIATRSGEVQALSVELATAIEQLPDDMQEVIFRRIFLQLPFEDVAQQMDRSAGATRVLWTRAIQRLRQRMEAAEQSASGEDGR